MILQGSQRGGAKNLALHLLKDDNDHVDVHELRGFVSDNLVSALNEAYAISKGTKAKQFLFSLSLNPPPDEKVSTSSFKNAIDRVEQKLGLVGQPRAVVFHEKKGRRHCHAVWSRTRADTMKAIPLPFTKRKLMDISRQLYVEHGWKMPKGMIQSDACNPLNFTLAQWQQAKRIGKDPKSIKQTFQDSWSLSKNLDQFKEMLKSRGYVLAKGDRRGFVAIDFRCEVFAVPKWTGIKAKEIKERLGKSPSLPSVNDVKANISEDMIKHLNDLQSEQNIKIEHRKSIIKNLQKEQTQKHNNERNKLKKAHFDRNATEHQIRQERFNQGLRGIWDRITGKQKRIRKQNEKETRQCAQRDQTELDKLIMDQLDQSKVLQKRLDRLSNYQETRNQMSKSDINQYNDIIEMRKQSFELERNVKISINPENPKHYKI